ncbi:BolA/IbaG family iron-sulfur metabolism protein [Halopenitus sp. H-Gu1]|uniref:BolA/IbaG family iron-sulfur metabolism protein n=1 Tax=Halopenitus sp. H-Gu1 TaxID=3242697 RepID=UPI00359E6E29
MELDAIAELIEAEIPNAVAEVMRPRVHDDEDEDDHYAAVVVSPAFEGEPLVSQHQQVYDALDDHMTTDIHAMEMQTYTPAEYAERGDGSLEGRLRAAGLLPTEE